MNRIVSILMITAMVAFLASCQQAVNTPSGGKTLTLNTLPVANGHDIVDIPTPSFNGNTISAGTISGHKVCLTWQSNSPDNVTFDYSTGTNPTTPTALNVDASGHDYGWEYWGCTQNAIVTVNNGGQSAYSGHYELSRTNPDNTVTSLGDITGDSYCDDNLADGTYTYTLKAKSLEGSTPNQMTHHSNTSTGYSVTVTSCTTVASGTVYGTVGKTVGNTGTWNPVFDTSWSDNTNTTGTAVWQDGAKWTQGSGNGVTLRFNVDIFTYTDNSCHGYATSLTGSYTNTSGPLYAYDGTRWATCGWDATNACWVINGAYKTDGSGGFGSLSTNTYTVTYCTSMSISSKLGSFTMVIP